MKYWFKRKYRQIKNVFRWLPIIWKQYDFDYNYSLEVFKFQLQKQAEFFESDRAITLSAKDKAKRIRTILKLMDKVYEEDYALEYTDEFEKIYGKGSSDVNFVNTKNPNLFSMKKKYELTESEEKIREMDQVYNNLFLNSIQKQKRAHKLLWDLIEHNIQGWWD